VRSPLPYPSLSLSPSSPFPSFLRVSRPPLPCAAVPALRRRGPLASVARLPGPLGRGSPAPLAPLCTAALAPDAAVLAPARDPLAPTCDRSWPLRATVLGPLSPRRGHPWPLRATVLGPLARPSQPPARGLLAPRRSHPRPPTRSPALGSAATPACGTWPPAALPSQLTPCFPARSPNTRNDQISV
jgi:hypothetical protein